MLSKLPKPKKNFVLLLGIFLFSSCSIFRGLPEKPKVEICAHDEPLAEVECFDSQNQENRTISINDTDRFIMFSPDDWGLVLLYIDRLERRLRRNKVKTELKKILNTSKLHNPKNEKAGAPLY